jgi:regulator of protease activity HflC (stomatin/prohibitin superfamily)
MQGVVSSLVRPLVLILLGVIIVGMILGLHQIPEGHVGVYWRNGALVESISDPGFQVMIPFITRFASVQVTLQTDTVTDIPCGTSGGTTVYFERIEVVNILDKQAVYNTIKLYGVNYDRTWIFDRIHHEINQFCSSHSLQEVYIDKFETLDEALATTLQGICDKYETGIQILGIRVTKPRIPDSVKANYESIEVARTELLVRQQLARIAKKEEDILRTRATIQAEREAEVARIDAEKQSTVSKINAEKEIMQKEAEKKKRFIDDEIALHQKNMLTDAEYYQRMRIAEANRGLYSEDYLRYVLYSSLANNAKIFFGENLPDIFSDLVPLNSSIPFP